MATLVTALSGAACESESGGNAGNNGGGDTSGGSTDTAEADTALPGPGESQTGDDVGANEDTAATADTEDSDGGSPSVGLGRCDYVNPFSNGAECKEYTGAGWTAESATADCAAVLFGASGTFVASGSCGYESELGRCVVEDAAGLSYLLVSSGVDKTQCNLAQTACETFGGGSFTAGNTCEGELDGPGVPVWGVDPFTQPYLNCQAPLAGEPAGNGPEGNVCTPVIISGCTEPGRRFEDYASCQDVLTQRPYYGYSVPSNTDENDPRLQDSEYMGNVAWMREQVEACACVCCHSDVAPDGPSGWHIDGGPLWIDTIPDSGLAMLAGLVPSDAFGAVATEENNGFDRFTTGLPTTDVARMEAFLVAEFLRRGYEEEDASVYPPFGGPLVDQSLYAPQACPTGVGVAADGRVTWTGGAARYLYVLEEGAQNPGAPPNLDVPAATVWLVDVPSTAAPFESGLVYGAVPDAGRQRVPSAGPAPTLTTGKTYYLYVLADIAIPLARCLFQVP